MFGWNKKTTTEYRDEVEARRTKETADQVAKDVQLLRFNERDEHDGEARRVGDFYVRETASYRYSLFSISGSGGSPCGYSIRHRAGAEPVKVRSEEIEAMREVVKWHDEKAKAAKTKAKKEKK